MAFDVFVNFGDIKGESTDKDHKDWVTATKLTFDVVPPVKGKGKGKGGHLTFEKRVDKSSPGLFSAVSKGTHFKQVTIDYQRQDGSKPVKYLEIKLKEVIISAISHIAEPQGHSPVPSERITLVYQSIEQVFAQQQPAGTRTTAAAAR